MDFKIKFIIILIFIFIFSFCYLKQRRYISQSSKENLYLIKNIDTTPRGKEYEVNDQVSVRFNLVSDKNLNNQKIYLPTNFDISEIFVNHKKTEIKSKYNNSYLLEIDLSAPEAKVELKGTISGLPTILKIENENSIIAKTIYLN